MNQEIQTNQILPYLLSILISLGCSVGYSTSNVEIDTLQALLPFVLLMNFNILMIYFGTKMLDVLLNESSPVDKLTFGFLILASPLLFTDLVASVLVPTLIVSGFPVRLLAMGFIGLIDLVALFQMQSI